MFGRGSKIPGGSDVRWLLLMSLLVLFVGEHETISAASSDGFLLALIDSSRERLHLQI